MEVFYKKNDKCNNQCFLFYISLLNSSYKLAVNVNTEFDNLVFVFLINKYVYYNKFLIKMNRILNWILLRTFYYC